MEIEARITKQYSGGARVSVSVDLPEGGFTINQLHVKDVRGRLRVTLPLSQHMHPYITLRGALKQSVYAAVEAAYRGGREEGAEHAAPAACKKGAAAYAK